MSKPRCIECGRFVTVDDEPFCDRCMPMVPVRQPAQTEPAKVLAFAVTSARPQESE